MTKDGSHSISIPEMNVTYHSVYGAVQESQHVFIEAGLNRSDRPGRSDRFNILEMGFGTGLNALLTSIEADKQRLPVHYTALELFPLAEEQTHELNYCEPQNFSHWQPVFKKLHTCDWEKEIAITPFFTLRKTNDNLINFSGDQLYHLVYFDAFAPEAQPELWTKEIFEKLYLMMSAGGILVTYCSKADVRRAMQAAGFSVEKIPGPPGKREMLRAVK